MTLEKLNSSKVPIIVFDKKLEELNNKILFPEKLAKAKEILSKGGLPKQKMKPSQATITLQMAKVRRNISSYNLIELKPACSTVLNLNINKKNPSIYI